MATKRIVDGFFLFNVELKITKDGARTSNGATIPRTNESRKIWKKKKKKKKKKKNQGKEQQVDEWRNEKASGGKEKKKKRKKKKKKGKRKRWEEEEVGQWAEPMAGRFFFFLVLVARPTGAAVQLPTSRCVVRSSRGRRSSFVLFLPLHQSSARVCVCLCVCACACVCGIDDILRTRRKGRGGPSRTTPASFLFVCLFSFVLGPSPIRRRLDRKADRFLGAEFHQ